MLRVLFLLLFLFGVSQSWAQDEIIEWAENYELQLSDFKNPESEIGPTVSNSFVQSGATVEIGFQMSSVSFMFTKNFNNKVSTKFYRKAAFLVAMDTTAAKRLLRLSQFDFDLTELYARKIRKELYENKKTFSKGDFFQPYFDKMIEELNSVSGKVYKNSEFGLKMDIVEKEHERVLSEIKELSDFCKECKPPKRKKKK
ncbi:MAG: hypothetical protein AAGA43_11265 [Bacteroidota bacterium]